MTSATFLSWGGPASQLNTYLQSKHQTPSWTNNPNHRKYHVLICSTASVLMKGTLRGSCSVDCRTQDKLEDTGIGWVRQLCRGYLYQFSYLTWWNCTTSPIRVVVFMLCLPWFRAWRGGCCIALFFCKKGTAKMGRHIVTMDWLDSKNDLMNIGRTFFHYRIKRLYLVTSPTWVSEFNASLGFLLGVQLHELPISVMDASPDAMLRVLHTAEARKTWRPHNW